MAMQITVTVDDVLDEARELVLADRFQDAHKFMRTHTDWTLSARYAFLRDADPRPVSYEPYGRGVRAVRTNS